MDAGAAVLWPQVEDLYTLMCLRAESGRSAFEREKQNSPLNPDLCEWPESYFNEDIWFDDWPSASPPNYSPAANNPTALATDYKSEETDPCNLLVQPGLFAGGTSQSFRRWAW